MYYVDAEYYPLFEEYILLNIDIMINEKSSIFDLKINDIIVQNIIKDIIILNYNYNYGKDNFKTTKLIRIKDFELFLRNKKINRLKNIIKKLE